MWAEKMTAGLRLSITCDTGSPRTQARGHLLSKHPLERQHREMADHKRHLRGERTPDDPLSCRMAAYPLGTEELHFLTEVVGAVLRQPTDLRGRKVTYKCPTQTYRHNVQPVPDGVHWLRGTEVSLELSNIRQHSLDSGHLLLV